MTIDDGVPAVERDRAWSGSYTDAVDDVSIAEEPGQLRTAAFTLDALERHRSPGALLDVGCWTGSLLAAGAARGWDVTGVEPSRWASMRARERGLAVRQGTVTSAPLTEGAYDAVVLCDVLEHLWAPLDALDVVRGSLREGGVLLVTVPNAGSAVARMLGRRWWSVLPMHVQYFTPTSLSALLRRAGFEVAETATHPKTFSVRYYADRLGAFISPLRPITRAVGRTGVGDKLVTPNFRDRLLVVAKP